MEVMGGLLPNTELVTIEIQVNVGYFKNKALNRDFVDNPAVAPGCTD